MAKNIDELLGTAEEMKTAEAPAAATGSVATIMAQDKPVYNALGFIQSTECEAVVGGALQRITFKPGTNPADVGTLLRTLDPNAKVRDDFPRKSFGGGRDTKAASVSVIQLRVSDSGKFWDLIGQNGDDISISVSKKNSDGFLDQLKGLNRLNEKHIAKLQEALDKKGQATVILPEDEKFGAKYWTSDDGKAFLDSIEPQPPVPQTEAAEAAKGN